VREKKRETNQKRKGKEKEKKKEQKEITHIKEMFVEQFSLFIVVEVVLQDPFHAFGAVGHHILQ